MQAGGPPAHHAGDSGVWKGPDLRRERDFVSAWLASQERAAFAADPRIQRVWQVMQRAQVTQAELLPALDAVLAEMTRRSEEAPDPEENRLSDWRDFAWLVCSAIGKCGILTPRDLWLRRLTVVAATADGQVDYYERLVATNGSAWANGLRRAKQFRALVKGNDCSLEALSALILVLEREYRSEGTAFWWMLAQAQWAAEPLLDTAV